MKHMLIKLILLTFMVPFLAFAQNKDEEKDLFSSSTFSGLKFRNIGPAKTAGRISDFAVNPDNPQKYYAAIASGNIWKTENNGITWKPVFDNYGSYSIGCITMDPNNHSILWVGTGENNSQRSVGYGDGVYKSSDGGKSWKNMGLENSEHIGKIIVDPRNSNVVYIAAQGPLWDAGGDRGLYKTTDRGKTWEAVLEISKHTGVTDMVMDPRDQDVIYAASYQRRRHVYTLINGGPESAIYKTTDGGENWEKLTSGIPSVDLGRIVLAISPVNPDVLYAIIEAQYDNGGFFRSTDRGASWEKRSDHIARSPQYYMEIVPDPQDVDRVYSLNTYTKVTNDGGKTWGNLSLKDRHVDDHALWIAPENTDHLIVGGDGGIYETFDLGDNWQFKGNLPVTQFYRVEVDNSEPFYYVYGGTQDNSTMGGPSQTLSSNGITNSDWFVTRGGDGFETQVDPINPDIVYSQSQYGGLVRYDRKSGERIFIQPQEQKDAEALKWNWNSPLIISPHNHKTLYFAANKLFKSTDRGNSWELVSPDLTRQIDRNQLEVMGRKWSVDAVSKNVSTSFYGNIVSLTESPLKEGLIYTGTDDGLIQVTTNGGEKWSKFADFPGVPGTTYVSCLYASEHQENRVYAAFDNHKRGDFKPYVLRSDDNGESWEDISGDLPEKGTVYSIAEDPVNPDLLFAGTEFGVFFTNNGGEKWVQLKSGIPTISIRDMEIQTRETDLVLASFGRGFYILDYFQPLRDVNEKILQKDAHIFDVEDALMYIKKRGRYGAGASYYKAENPPFGATFTYYLQESIKTKEQKRREKEKELREESEEIPYPSWEELRKEDREEKPFLEFVVEDSNGNVVRKLRSNASKGINRITWDLRYPSTNPITKTPENTIDEGNSGTPVLPGKYQVTMYKNVNGEISQLAGPVEFEAKALQNTTLPAEDSGELVAFQQKVAEFNRIVRGAVEEAETLGKRLKKIKYALFNTPENTAELQNKVQDMEEKLMDLMVELTGDETKSKRNAPTYPTITDRVGTVIYGLWGTTSSPTQTQQKNLSIAKEEFNSVYSELENLLEVQLPELEEKMAELKSPYTPGRLPD